MLHALLYTCLLWTAALASLVENQSKGWEEAPSLLYNGTYLRCFQRGDARVVEPYIALRVPQDQPVRVDPLGQGFYFTVLLEVTSSVMLPEDGLRKWYLLKVHDFDMELRKAVQGPCSTECPPVTVSGHWDQGQDPRVTFRCRSHAACQGALQALRFTGPDHEELRSALRFIFYGQASGKRFELTRVGLPVANAISTPFQNAFWFEGDKLMLYTIEANSGFLAYETFQSEQTYSVPQDGSLPRIYRSGLLDQLAHVAATGRWQIVAEMRTAGRVVSQAVFSAEASGLDKNSWFSASRLLSTKPYWFGRSDYNIFDIDGDVRVNNLRRRFIINRHYGGCEKDTGLFFVSDMRDGCEYNNKHWLGQGPVLVYSTTDKISYHAGSVALADRFLIYLRLDRPVLPPFATTPSALSGAFNFENGKVLLFTVKAHSGHEAVATFLSRQPSLSRATSGALPDVYRSDLIDSIGAAVVASGKQFIVAEMRVGNRMVSQVVFDTSINRLSLDKQNWFTMSRFVSSYPYQAVRNLTQSDGFFHNPDAHDPRFKFFSIPGDEHKKRGFFILSSNGDCASEKAFWVVADAKDSCQWAGFNDWTGRAPVLKYTESQATPMQTKVADRFLIYLK